VLRCIVRPVRRQRVRQAARRGIEVLHWRDQEGGPRLHRPERCGVHYSRSDTGNYDRHDHHSPNFDRHYDHHSHRDETEDVLEPTVQPV